MRINRIKNKNRIDMAIMFGNLGFKLGAEIGVRFGEYSEILCTRIKCLEKLYLIDPWNVVFEDPVSKQYGLKHQERFYRRALRRLRKYPACEFVKKTSMEAVRDIEYNSLDFVYIDGSHTFDYVMTDIIEWSKRIKRGGIVSGDDYKHHRHGDVITPVNTYVQAHRIETLNIIEPLETDHYPTPQWWFVKP